MKDPKEQKLIDACVEADRKCVEVHRKLRKYQESIAQQGGKAGG